MTGELFDMHCHLGFYDDPVVAARTLARSGVSALCATVTPREYECLSAALANEPNVRMGVGLHPWWVADGSCGEADVGRAAELAHRARYVAEVGLDFARGREESAPAQLDALGCVLDACAGGGHVLSVHAVRAGTPLLDALERHGTCDSNTVVLHWFSGTSEELARARRMGCLFSVGVRMLATRRGREYARQVPARRLLLETDLPSNRADGAELAPDEQEAELRQALDALCELHGPDTARLIAETSARLLGMRP